MYEVHVYTSVSGKSPRKEERTGFYRIETKTNKGMAGLENTITLTATQNRAELLVLNEALKRVHKECELVIHTDSAYVAAGLNEWIKLWDRTGWVNAKGKPVANSEEWRKTLNLLCKKPFRAVLNQNEQKNEGKNGGKP